MIDQETAVRIAEVVKRVKQAHPREHTDASGRPVTVELGLEQFFREYLKPELDREFSVISLMDRAIAGLMAYLGPADAGPPPLIMHQELESHLRQQGASSLPPDKQTAAVVQTVLAYGCGWRRTVRAGQPRWDDLWPNAFFEMALVCRNLLSHIRKRLAETIEEFRQTVLEDHAKQDVYEELASDAVLLTLRFLEPPPTPIEHEYQRYCSLHQWEPARSNIYRWFQICLEGGADGVTASGHYLANKFDKGLYFPVLEERKHLHNGMVAVQECSNCRRTSDYHDQSCPDCGETAFSVTPESRLFVPGVYLPKRFWKCKVTASHPEHYFVGKLYAESANPKTTIKVEADLERRADPTAEPEFHVRRNLRPECPIHHEPSSQRPTETIWVRARFAQSPDLPRIEPDDHEN